MKYAIVIPEGAPDEPLRDLEQYTPLAVAQTPMADALSLQGRLGTATTCPRGLPCTDDVTLMCLLGLDPHAYHCGPAVIEAAGRGEPLPQRQWTMRLSLVTFSEDMLIDHTAGSICDAEAAELFGDLEKAIHDRLGDEARDVRVVPTSDHRGLLFLDRTSSLAGLTTHPPPLILDRPMKKHLPGGEHAELLRQIINLSADVFADHEVNRMREELGEAVATHAWPWGIGEAITMPSFASRYGGLGGAMICRHDLPAGLARMIGWDVIRIDTSLPGEEADAGGKAEEALDKYDVVCVYTSSPDSAAHRGDVNGKIDGLEAVDEHVIGPLFESINAYGRWRMLVIPGHYTGAVSRRHDPKPTPFAMAGERIDSLLKRPFTEQAADEADLHVEIGRELMEYFLYGSGLRRRHGG